VQRLPFTPVSVAQRSWFQRVTHTHAFAAGDYQVGTLTGKATINVAYPLLDEAQEIQAIINVALDLRWLNDRLAEALLPEGTTVSLLDRQGTIVARSPDPDRWVGRSLPNAQIMDGAGRRRNGPSRCVGWYSVRIQVVGQGRAHSPRWRSLWASPGVIMQK
jgi:C4-dicarboxylate-specific signal transduction histidine kinase